ncbi:hypothetical protein BSKO_09184 [Bryopsis sp. KO-2023]|nr:hypothetical protein BSKO_09184 [Bryopsis sp. KO-2023]
MMNMEAAMEEERLRFFEEAIVQAKSDYEKDNTDAQALTRWGGALLELAHLHRGERACSTIEEAIEKLQTALDLDGTKHNALWCLGNAYTSKGFLMQGDKEQAHDLFNKALDCFKKAQAEDPTNEIYRRAVEVTEKAPEIYEELQRQLGGEKEGGGADSGGASSSRSGADGAKKTKGGSKDGKVSDAWWDFAGWACLVGAGALILAYSQKGASTST